MKPKMPIFTTVADQQIFDKWLKGERVLIQLGHLNKAMTIGEILAICDIAFMPKETK